MFKRFFGILLITVMIISTLAGCGSGSNKADASVSASAPSANHSGNMSVTFSESVAGEAGYDGNGQVKVYDSASTVSEAPMESDGLADALTGTGSTVDAMSNAILAERKIIRSANLSIEVENFDEARNNINSIINGVGIVQESNVSTERVYIGDDVKLIKNGTIVLRVYKEKFDSVFGSLKGIGNVMNESINGQDVTDRFVDTESRLRLLKLEQSRLEAYLAKLEDLDKIFKTESRLTEIRQEIESLTGNLNKMSSLVELSTITITMNEKNPYSVRRTEPLTYGEKLVNNLKASLESVVNFLGNLLIFLVAAIPVLIMLALFALLFLAIYRRIRRKAVEASVTMKKASEEEKKEE